MVRKPERPAGVDRREFIAGAGALVAASTLATGEPLSMEKDGAATCRVLVHDRAACVGCGVCSLMCSLYREGESGPGLSRCGIGRDPFSYDFSFTACRQCRFPQCYAACPLQGVARRIDGSTGTVYVDPEACVGCGSCVDACLFDPPGSTLHPDTGVALNCDRCMDRDEGPICVEYCTMQALSCATDRPPRGIVGRSG